MIVSSKKGNIKSTHYLFHFCSRDENGGGGGKEEGEMWK